MPQKPAGRPIFWGVSLIPIGLLIAMLAPALGPERTDLADDVVWLAGLFLSGIGVAMLVSAPFGRQPPPDS